MQISREKLESYLPIFFKNFNRFIVLMWKLGLGKLINCWPAVIGRIMVIGHQGRGSGSAYLTPVNYCPHGDYVYCTAAFGEGSDWFLNVVANPQVEIWLPDGWYAAKAELVEDPQERLEMLRKVLIASGFSAPLFAGINPQTIGDEEFKEMTGDYRLLRISRQSPRTGSDGPGSLAWLWPFVVLVLLFRRGRKKR